MSMSKQACNSYGLYLKLLSSTIRIYCVLKVYACSTCLNISSKVQLKYFEEIGHKNFDIVLFTETNTQVNICKTNYTYMSLMDLYLMLCVQFDFILSDAEVEEEILATICHLLCNGQNLVFWGGGNLPLQLRF